MISEIQIAGEATFCDVPERLSDLKATNFIYGSTAGKNNGILCWVGFFERCCSDAINSIWYRQCWSCWRRCA